MASKSLLLAICFSTFFSVYGCGALPSGQGATINFNISGFKLPAAMAFSKDPAAPPLAPTISTTEQAARSFIQRMVKLMIEDVLYQQGRSAGLSDDVISMILGQLDVSVNYEPLECIKVLMAGAANAMMDVVNCQIINGVVTNICSVANAPCIMPPNLKPVPDKHLSISGTVRTTNIIMANWSKEMWQIVLNRVVRNLNSGSLASSFFSAQVILR